jgi:TolA-binding protein
VISLLAVIALGSAGLFAQSPEDLARRNLESGRAFLSSQNYVEAVKDFETVLERYATSTVADDALLELAAYQLDVLRDTAAAETRATQLLKTYSTSDSAPMAQVILGRVKLANGLTPENLSGAIAEFERVARLYPGTEAVPASMYFAGEAARLAGDGPQAIRRFTELTTRFPNSPWTAKGLLGSAVALTRAGQAPRAIEQLQRIRNKFPSTPQAVTAMQWNTMLYRLYVRGPAQQPAYVFTSLTVPPAPGKLKDVTDIAVDGDTLLVASRTGVAGYASNGRPTVTVPATDALSLTFDQRGKLITVHETGLRAEGRSAIGLALPAVNGKVPTMKLEEAAVTRIGDFLVADAEEKTIYRFGRDLRFIGAFLKPVEVRRLAITDLDHVAVLHSNNKMVTLLQGDGKTIRQISEKGQGYQFRNPVDVAFDAFGHLYVLDRSSVVVFSADGSRVLSTFSIPEKSPGAIGEAQALAVDRAGRMYVMDSRSDSVKVYR